MFLLQVSVWELHNSMVSSLEEGGIKGTKYAYNEIIISDYTLRNIFPYQLKNMSALYKVMCGCECCIYVKSMH